ncbi:expressed unknown protein [Seminavis robusta]|uniref:Uncharacterized protein n=1 Tax=Seminavis robusta TaxID=568900 RepID=A0A9N8HQH4_9STRA|nr:expressed unknown protein [Seminavis robusta]|eukprot:Sro1166_g248290.1 n/a (271) ;mRNA; r:33493-34305
MSSSPFSTNSSNGAKRCNISVDGESFDITNLLEELPTTSTTSDGHDDDDKRDALKKNYPSIGKLLAQSSHHKLRASFLGREDSFVFPTSSSHHQTGVPGLSELNESMSSFSESHGFLEGSSWHNTTLLLVVMTTARCPPTKSKFLRVSFCRFAVRTKPGGPFETASTVASCALIALSSWWLLETVPMSSVPNVIPSIPSLSIIIPPDPSILGYSWDSRNSGVGNISRMKLQEVEEKRSIVGQELELEWIDGVRQGKAKHCKAKTQTLGES